MADQATAHEMERTHPDARADGSETRERPQRAEISNYEVVQHHFRQAAERLALPDDLAEVLSTSYREVTVQIPI